MKSFKWCACCLMVAIAVVISAGDASFGASAGMEKSAMEMADGTYLIKLKVTGRSASIYSLKLTDPKAAIIDVYAPKGWCIVTDGGDFIARTQDSPIKASKTLEFIIHSSTKEINYTWSVYGRIKQLGKAETL